jgi:hypothetical protein
MRKIVIAALLFATPAWGHEAVSGWAYPRECCSGLDCRPQACDMLEEIDGGRIRDIENGQTYSREMVRSSQDNKCHVCTDGGLSNSKPICVFLQLGS